MYKLLLAPAILVAASIGYYAYAQTVTNPQPAAAACAYNSSVPTVTAGSFFYVQCDSSGRLRTK